MVEWQTIKDRCCFPLLAFLSSEQARALGFTPIDEERVTIALRHCRGLLLDVGCGMNELAMHYRSRQGTAIGVDVYPWPGRMWFVIPPGCRSRIGTSTQWSCLPV
jgi:hypothetical protein